METTFARDLPLPPANRWGKHVWLMEAPGSSKKNEIMATMTRWSNDLVVDYTALLHLAWDREGIYTQVVSVTWNDTQEPDPGEVFADFTSLMASQFLIKEQSDNWDPGFEWWDFVPTRAGRRWVKEMSRLTRFRY